MSMLVVALVLGVVEGLTEYLPVSSTGHLHLASHLMGFHGQRADTFDVFIQLGAILAVVWEYRGPLNATLRGLRDDDRSRRLVWNVLVAFLPSALVGVAMHETITAGLFTPRSVAAALITGAVAMFVVESIPHRALVRSPEEVTRRQAVLIGLAQCVALWPGFSRSAATILGGLSVGLDRRAATEFSFYLAIPTMFSATIYDLIVHHTSLEAGDLGWLLISLATAFVVARVTIRWLLRYVSSHSFHAFAWYRIALGAAVLYFL